MTRARRRLAQVVAAFEAETLAARLGTAVLVKLIAVRSLKGHLRPVIVLRSVEVRGKGNLRTGRRVRMLRGATVDARRGSIAIGDYSVVCRYAVVEAAGGDICVGSNCSIGDFCNLYGQGGLTIGDNVLIASGVRIIPSAHRHETTSLPIREQGLSTQGILIEDDVWLGANAVLLDGVRIGAGSIVGAGAVVNRDVPDKSVVAGVPARVLRQRSD